MLDRICLRKSEFNTKQVGLNLNWLKPFLGVLVCVLMLANFTSVSAQVYSLNSGQSVDSFTDSPISPDGSQINYLAGQRIRSEPITSGVVSTIGPNLDISALTYSEDGRYIVFLAITADSKKAIYSLNVENSTLIQLHKTDAFINDDFITSPNGQFVLYRISDEKLFLSAIDGTSQTQLNAADQFVPFGPRFSPDSQYALYYTNKNGVRDFNSYNLNTGIKVKLNASDPVVTARTTPDGMHVIYRSSSTIVQGTSTAGVVNLNKVPIGGGQSTNLVSFTKGSGVSGSFGLFNGFEISPDGQHIVYRADPNIDGVFELFLTSINGGNSRKLNGPLVTGGDVIDMLFSPDSRYVVYRARQDHRDVMELYSVPVSSGSAIKLNGFLDTQDLVVSVSTGLDIGVGAAIFTSPAFSISPNSESVVYLVDPELRRFRQQQNVYRVPISGGQAQKINNDLGNDRNVIGVQFSPDGKRLFYKELDHSNQMRQVLGTPIANCATANSSGAFLCRENLIGVADLSSTGLGTSIEQSVMFEGDVGTVKDVFLEFHGLRKTFPGNLTISLTAPNGTKAIVFSKSNNQTLNFAGQYRFIDTGDDLMATVGGLTPLQKLPVGDYAPSNDGVNVSLVDTFTELEGQGEWTLKIEGDLTLGTGVLSGWTLSLLTQSASLFFPIKASNGNVFTIQL